MSDHELLAAGEWRQTGAWAEVQSPYDGSLVGRVAQGDAALVARAIAAADRVFHTLTFSATEARKLTGGTVPMEASPAGKGKLGAMLRVPCGAVGAISPFNFPLNLVAHGLGPAIAAGNSSAPVGWGIRSMANDSKFGLQAGVFTRDIAKGLKAAETLEFGGVLINEVPTLRAALQGGGS